jgi:pilus assembly protein FimV
MLNTMRFAIERRGNQRILRMTTTAPVNEPFVELLVELQWSGGRLVREYTFLLDPPEYKSRQAIAAAQKPAAPAPAAPAPEAAKPPPPVEAKPIEPAAPSARSSSRRPRVDSAPPRPRRPPLRFRAVKEPAQSRPRKRGRAGDGAAQQTAQPRRKKPPSPARCLRSTR